MAAARTQILAKNRSCRNKSFDFDNFLKQAVEQFRRLKDCWRFLCLLLDTGAEASVLNRDALRRLFPRVRVVSSVVLLRDFKGKLIT